MILRDKLHGAFRPFSAHWHCRQTPFALHAPRASMPLAFWSIASSWQILQYSTYSGDNQLQALCNSTIGLQCHWQRERGEECILFSLCSSDPKVGGLMARHVCCPSVRGCRDVTSTDSDTPNTVNDSENVPGYGHTGAIPLPEPFWKWRKGNLCLECWNGLES